MKVDVMRNKSHMGLNPSERTCSQILMFQIQYSTIHFKKIYHQVERHELKYLKTKIIKWFRVKSGCILIRRI